MDTLRWNVDFTEQEYFLMGVAALRVIESTSELVISKKICAFVGIAPIEYLVCVENLVTL
jgi:hypothetical protein